MGFVPRSDIDQDWRVGPFYWNYAYHAAGRLNNVQTNANGSVTQEAAYQYFASGKLQQLVLGYSDPTVATVNYHYNQRDWLTSDSSADFWEQLTYDQPSLTGGAPQYNGNISCVTYSMSGDAFTPSTQDMQFFSQGVQPAPTTTVGYSYTYDNANRMTAATFEFLLDGEWGQAVSYGQNTAYDDNGNLKTLSRYENNATLVDNLSYNYRPGTDIDTLITNSAGAGSSYRYDSDGNMTSDSKNNIGFVLYDIYNEPEALYKTNGSNIQYKYDVNGDRVEKQVAGTSNYYFRGQDGNTEVIIPDQSNYGDYVYNTFANGDKIGQIVWDNTSSNLSHYFYLKDHLGDVKMILDDYGTPQVWNDYYPFGETMPGRSHFNAGPDTRYQYISVENDVETGYLDTGDRLYDPWKLGFDQPEPVTTDTTLMDWSMYQYGFDNPVRFKDPTGKWPDWATLGIEVGSWIQNEFSGAQNSIVNSMGYQNASQEQMQSQAESQSSAPMVPSAKQMSALEFKDASGFLYGTAKAQLLATGETLSLAATGGALDGAPLELTGSLVLAKTAVNTSYNVLTGKSILFPVATAELSLALPFTPLRQYAKAFSTASTLYGLYNLYHQSGK